uniref:PISTILLATA-like protein n=1 Tax=Fagopyrum esculentum TaxID=3617 RepID=T1P705_FAGES|nr:PISTILLATA-like protein [Fagopyrum esculentum]
MGRGKIEIKRIENSSNRQVTYTKRRNGIIKKAKEITVLCDAKVSLVIFASSGRMHEYCSPNTTVVDVLDKYQSQSGQRLWDAKHENLSNEIDRVKKENGDLQIELRHLRGEDITSLPYQDLIRMEAALNNGLTAISERQMELMKMHQKNGRLLEEESRELAYVFQEKQQMAMEGSMRAMDNNGFAMADENEQQMPFGFRVQPMQPNLQEERFM